MNAETNIPHKKQKRIQRQNNRKHPEISKQIILFWEELRQKNVEIKRKHELCDKIMDASKTVLSELIRFKVTARVYESVIEFGVDEHRWTIFEILKNDLMDLCKAKYAHFAVISMLKHGMKEQRLAVFELMKGHIVEFLQHTFASKVVEAAYNEFANATQRGQMIQEFYGKIFAMFTNDNEIKHLSDFTSNSNYDMPILQNLHKVIMPMIQKSQTDLTIVQHVLNEFITVLMQAKATLNENKAKPYVTMLDELVEATQNQLLVLCNTRLGTKIAMNILYQCPAKIRKKIAQDCKDVIVKLCTSEHAHLFVLAMIDQVDDTKLILKSILKPIMDNIDEIYLSTHGRKVLHFIVNHRDGRSMSNYTKNLLARGDGNEHSKKEAAVRAKEILELSKKAILRWLEKTIDECIKYTSTVTLVQSIVNKCVPTTDDERQSYHNILLAIAQHLDEPIEVQSAGVKRKAAKDESVVKKKAKNFTGQYKTEENDSEKDEVVEDKTLIDCNLIETISGQCLLKSLCKMEREKQIESFSALCIDNISYLTMQTFISSNRAAFFLVFLFEAENPTVQEYLKSTFQSFEKQISNSQFTGAKILYEHLFK